MRKYLPLISWGKTRLRFAPGADYDDYDIQISWLRIDLFLTFRWHLKEEE